MKNVFIGCLTAASLFGSVAQAETYICHVKLNGPAKGFISDTYTVKIVDRSLNAVVSDAIILATNGRAVVATQSPNTSKRLGLKWILYGVKGPRNEIYGIINYKLSIWKSLGNKISVVAKFDSAEGSDLTITKDVSASGTCKLR